MKKTYSKIIGKIQKTDILWLVIFPSAIGIGILFIVMRIYEEPIPIKYSSLVLAISSFITSLGGLFQIIKRESPGIFIDKPIKGVWPVISGSIWFGFCFLVGIIQLYFVFFQAE